MKIAGTLLTLLILFGEERFGYTQPLPGILAGSSSVASPGYTVTLTQPTTHFTIKSTIEATMTVTNITRKDILWSAVRSSKTDSWYAGFQFLLKKDGREVETTFFHRKISGRQRPNDPPEVWGESTVLLPKPPGIMFANKVNLNLLYQITEPGVYTLEITRLAEDDKTTVRSNTVAFVVDP